MKKLTNIIFWAIVIALGAGTVFNLNKLQTPNNTAAVSQITQEKNHTINGVIPIEPIEGFRERITKKPFGIYITPQTSPIRPEKFRGFHTGVDIEYEGVAREIPVKAIAAGRVAFSQTAGGYGGVMVIRHKINDQNLFALYGHLDPKSMLPVRTEVNKGQIIGVLGDGKTTETDGERKHLHFAILKKNSLDIRGYVQSEEELKNGWHSPVEFLSNFSKPR